ncbi:MAG: choice-of-anchor I family protein [Flavobacteriales bacterium]|nr:choice-of-anchor I family protein [Flavobacteriales bacterium]
MKNLTTLRLGALASGLALAIASHAQTLRITPIGTYQTGLYGESAAEIVDYDPGTRRVFSTNAAANSVDAIDISDPSNPTLLFTMDMSPYGGGANSVVVIDGAIAIACEAFVKTDNGSVVFLDLNGNFLNQLTVGALPDMITRTPDGTKLLVANEGEPISYLDGIDPEGSISIIDINGGIASLSQAQVTTIGFEGYTPEMLPGVRIFGPNASVAQDMEPEYIAVSADSQTAFVVCQENNAVVRIDLNTNTIVSITSLGMKDHSLPGNGLDASDQDGMINIANWPVKGLYMPDAIACYTVNGEPYVIYANEGDARDDWPGYEEGRRIGNAGYQLDPDVFPNAADLKQNANLGRLTASRASGDLDGDGLFEEIHVLGARSFSIRNAAGELLYDSGEDFERITAQRYPTRFNASNSNNNFDNRSDDKGPEPEAVEVALIDGRHYAFIGLERIGGIMVYDVTDPTNAQYLDYVNNRNFGASPLSPEGLDSGVECLRFVHADQSPNGEMLLISANEVSGTVTIFQVDLLYCEPGDGITRVRQQNGNGPVTTTQLASFEAPQNDGDHFTATLGGLICPPVSGYYRFFISADHRAELYLSPGTTPVNGPAIARCPAPVPPHVYTQFAQQSSAAIWLEAGELRYLYATHREANGPDHVSVAWARADGIHQDPIPGIYFFQPAQPKDLASLLTETSIAPATFGMYPNPANDRLHVELLLQEAGQVRLELIDPTGRLLIERTTSAEEGRHIEVLDITGLRPGMYLMRMTSGMEQETKPFVVMR